MKICCFSYYSKWTILDFDCWLHWGCHVRMWGTMIRILCYFYICKPKGLPIHRKDFCQIIKLMKLIINCSHILVLMTSTLMEVLLIKKCVKLNACKHSVMHRWWWTIIVTRDASISSTESGSVAMIKCISSTVSLSVLDFTLNTKICWMDSIMARHQLTFQCPNNLRTIILLDSRDIHMCPKVSQEELNTFTGHTGAPVYIVLTLGFNCYINFLFNNILDLIIIWVSQVQ